MIQNSTNDATPPAIAADQKLTRFISSVTDLLDQPASGEGSTVGAVMAAMRALVAQDDWLDERFTVPHPQFYQQFLLHADPQGRFSVISFVWGPGQETPIHDHGTWGVIGMLRGAEITRAYSRNSGMVVAQGHEELLAPGEVTMVSPTVGDIHVVRNAFYDRVSISIHAYGTDIGLQRRNVYDPLTGLSKTFVSGYANTQGRAA